MENTQEKILVTCVLTEQMIFNDKPPLLYCYASLQWHFEPAFLLEILKRHNLNRTLL